MQDEARAPLTQQSVATFITTICLWPLQSLLRTGDPHATVDRLFDSQHVRDLRLIGGFALLVFYATILVLFFDVWNSHPKNYLNAARHTLTSFAPVLAIVIGVLSWAYQVGSARLGVVDLFACEISTLCRVAAVNDTVQRQVDRFNKGPGEAHAHPEAPEAPARPFTSQESYFPVFESNPGALQTLEAKVVVNITAFYTYMKAVRDAYRTLAAIEPQASDLQSPPEAAAPGPWREGARNGIYMLFLALESARLAIGQLVEFEPEGVERTIVILISELEAYSFLCGQFNDPKDVHYARIRQREADYRRQAPEVYWLVKRGAASLKRNRWKRSQWERSQWKAAVPLLPELAKRYQDATRRSIEDRAPAERKHEWFWRLIGAGASQGQAGSALASADGPVL
jgi:hypothetical protein